MAYGTLVPLPRITPVFPAVEAGVLAIGSTEAHICDFLHVIIWNMFVNKLYDMSAIRLFTVSHTVTQSCFLLQL